MIKYFFSMFIILLISLLLSFPLSAADLSVNDVATVGIGSGLAGIAAVLFRIVLRIKPLFEVVIPMVNELSDRHSGIQNDLNEIKNQVKELKNGKAQ